MYLIQKTQADHNQRERRKLLLSIKTAMKDVFQTVQVEQNSISNNKNNRDKIHHVTLVNIPQLQTPLKLWWQFKLLQHVLIIKVSLSSQQPVSQEIRVMSLKKKQKMIFYLNHVNNMTFNENQGEFYLHRDSKIIYQYREDNWYAIKNVINIKLHLTKKIRKISQLYTKNIQEFLVRFKIIHNPEMQKQQMQKIEKLYQLKYFFEENKKNLHYPPQLYQNIHNIRRHCSSTDLTSVKKFDQRLLFLVEGKSLNPNSAEFFSNPSKFQSYEQLKIKFKSKSLSYANFSQYNQIIPYHLVIAMEIIDMKNQTFLKDKGGFGKLSKALYTCKYGKTVYEDINKQLQNENYISEQIFNRYLCKKSSLSTNCPSFQNEKQALMKLRNKKSPHIAQYYCNIFKGKPFDDGSIYMDVYASNIEDLPIKLKHKFKIILEVIKGKFICKKGLSFLNSNGIIHRDMKPENIVVDRQMNSKIIDFGSCCNIYQKQNLFKPFDSKLRSTKGYFIKYQQYLQSLSSGKIKPSMMSKQQFYEHAFFDIYSYGKIIHKLFNLEEYEFVHQDFLMSQIFYLKQKCCELNPADRLTHQEIQFFIQTLVKIQKDNIN